MEDMDDDFGDLYADVEFQANSTINGVSNFAGFCVEIDDDHTAKCVDLSPKSVDELIQENQDDEVKTALSVEVNGEREVGVDNESDSEDDLNIVLNGDDDDGGDEGGSVFPVSRGVGFDGDEEQEGGFEDVVEGDGFGKNWNRGDQSRVGDGLEPSPKGRGGGGGGEKGNVSKGSYQTQYLQYKYIRPRRASFPTNAKANGLTGVGFYSSSSVRGDRDDHKLNVHMDSSSLTAQIGHNFSLPRYRTILDVNIAAFERKPWRHRKADITDFFNFGFDEESWNLYCDHVEEVRQQTSSLTRTPNYEHSNAKEAYKAGAEYETGAHKDEPKKVAYDRGAVSALSRRAYREKKQFEVEWPKGRVIQVEDSILERQPSMDVRRAVDRDPDVVIQISVQDHMEDSSGSGKEESTHKGSALEASENGDFGADDDIHHFDSGSGDELPSKLLEGDDKRLDRPFAKRCSELSTPCNPVFGEFDNHVTGQISDVDGHCSQKVIGSSSEGHAEAMETSINTNEKVCSETCRTALSLGETESLLGDQTQREPSSSCSGGLFDASGNGTSADPERFQNHVGEQSPKSVSELQESVTSDYYQSSNSKSHHSKGKTRDCKNSARNRSPFPQDLKHYSWRLLKDSELKRHHDYDGSSCFPYTGDAYYSSVGQGRQDKRLQSFDSYGGEGSPYCNESELSFNYFGGRVSYNEVRGAYSKRPRRNRHRFGDEADRHLNRRWDEGEYFLEQRMSRVDDEAIGKDWHHYGRGITLNPRTCKEPRRLVSNYSSYSDKKRVTRWRGRGDEFQLKRIEEDDCLLDRKNGDDFVQEGYGYYGKEREYFDGKYGRHLASTRRGGKIAGGRERKCNSPSMDLDNSWPVSNEDEYWRSTDQQSLPSYFGREPHTANRGRGFKTISRRNAYDVRLTERHGRHSRRQIAEGRSRGRDWFGSNHDAGDSEGRVYYPDGQVHYGRNHWQYESFHCTEDEYFCKYEDEFLSEKASFSFGRTIRNKRIGSKQKHIDDVEVEQHRIKLMREGSSSNRIERSSDIVRRGNNGKPLLRCRDSVDLQLFVEEGKSSGRCSNAGSIKCNNKHESMDLIISADHSESHAEKAGQAEEPKVEINQNEEKWLDKFPITQQNDALDIEEGQIIAEEVHENPSDQNFGSENVADTRHDKKKGLLVENATKQNKVDEGFDNPRILAMMAKMEKRRERFKEPITLKKENDLIPNPQVDPVVETIETKQHRPARKRRWGGS